MFDQLSENLQDIFKGFRGQNSLTEENIDGAIREVKRALINSDVSLKAVKTFTTKVRENAIGREVIKGVSPHEQFIKIIHDELTNLLGSEKKELKITEPYSVILALGLQGAGKTTTCAKLGNWLKKKGRKVLLVPLDLKRPAAIEQLKILGEQIEVEVFNVPEGFIGAGGNKPLELAKNAIEYGKSNGFEVIILDSAGRLQLDSEMMAEILLIDRILQPQEKLLVIDSMIGQEAASIAASFDTQIGVTGVILTKLDGDAKGGAALSVVEEIKKPIKLVGMGEKIEDLQEFHPDRIASRILGMGDVLTLVEQAQEKIKEDEAKDLEKKLLSDFNFDTFLQAQNMMGKMGNFSNIFNMMGVGGMFNKMGIDLNKETTEKMLSESEVKMKKFKSAINSMTKEERLKPDLLNLGRKLRIAKGAGLKEKDLDQLVKEFKMMKKMMDQVKPFMGMFKGSNQSVNPENIFGNLLPGTNSSQSGNRASRRLSKGFKPKKGI